MAKQQAFIQTSKTAPYPCPVCHRILDAATGVWLDKPNPDARMKIGDVTCCGYCGSVLVLTTIGFRLATDEDMRQFDKYPLLQQFLQHFATRHQRKQ